MSQQRHTIRRPSLPVRAELMNRYFSDNPNECNFRNMLDNIHPGCYVESEVTRQCGQVLGVIRDRFGIPAAIKVEYELDGEFGIDYIPAPCVSLWEPAKFYVPDVEYDDWEDCLDDDDDDWEDVVYEDEEDEYWEVGSA